MNWYFAVLMTLIGLFMAVSGFSKRDTGLYHLLRSRSEKLWGNNVDLFYGIVGSLISVLGILYGIGIL